MRFVGAAGHEVPLDAPFGAPRPCDSIAIYMSEDGANTQPWQIDVDAVLQNPLEARGGPRVRVGSIVSVPPSVSGLPGRVVGSAVCPGAQRWVLTAYPVLVANTPDLTSTAVAEIDMSPVAWDLPVGAQGGMMVAPNVFPLNIPSTQTPPGPFEPVPLQFSQVLGPGYFLQMRGINAGGADRFVQIYDATAVPGDGALNFRHQIKVASGASFAIDVRQGQVGEYYFKGLVWVISSTATQLTHDAAATFWTETQMGI